LELDERVAAEPGDVERVTRRVPRQRAGLVLPDRRDDLVRALARRAEERELVRDRRLETAAVAAGALARAGRLDRRLALERHHGLLIAEKQRGECTARERVRTVAAEPAAPRRGLRRQRDVLGLVA